MSGADAWVGALVVPLIGVSFGGGERCASSLAERGFARDFHNGQSVDRYADGLRGCCGTFANSRGGRYDVVPAFGNGDGLAGGIVAPCEGHLAVVAVDGSGECRAFALANDGVTGDGDGTDNRIVDGDVHSPLGGGGAFTNSGGGRHGIVAVLGNGNGFTLGIVAPSVGHTAVVAVDGSGECGAFALTDGGIAVDGNRAGVRGVDRNIDGLGVRGGTVADGGRGDHGVFSALISGDAVEGDVLLVGGEVRAGPAVGDGSGRCSAQGGVDGDVVASASSLVGDVRQCDGGRVDGDGHRLDV